MKNISRRYIGGFTLVEILVVVLIIGILSAIAVPQYTKAVNRAKAAEAWTVGKAVIDAQKVYFLENGRYTNDLESLNINPPELKNWDILFHEYEVGTSGGNHYFDLRGKNSLNDIFLTFYYDEPSYLLCHTGSGNGSEKCNSFLPSTDDVTITTEIGCNNEVSYRYRSVFMF